MSTGYASAHQHVDDELARVALILQRQIQLHWEQGILPRIKDEFSGTFVSGGEVAALLAGGIGLSPEGQVRLDELDAAIRAYGEVIEERLAHARTAGTTLPWDTLRAAFHLSATEERALWVLVAVEVSSRHRQLARYLTNDAARVHSDVGLLEVCVYNAPSTRELLIDELAPEAPLFHFRLVEPAVGRGAADQYPFLLRPLRVAPRVIDLVHGRMALDRDLSRACRLDPPPPRPVDLIGDAEPMEAARGLLREAALSGRRGVTSPALILVGPVGCGKRSLVATIGRELGCGVLHVDAQALPDDRDELHRLGRAIAREAVLFRAIPLITGIDLLLAGERGAAKLATLDGALADFLGPLVATMTVRDARAPSLSRGAVRVDLAPPSEGERIQIWRRALDGSDGARVADEFNAARVAARYPITGGLIERAASSAAALARGRGDRLITEADAHAGLRGVLDEKISTLGTRVTRSQRWEDLVVAEETHDGIQELLSRLAHRRLVYEEWGFARKLVKGLGVSALFAGPPGTGKTMVAGLIADELDLDLYQIELSRVVSKYVGETEKNLAEVFDAAEAGHAILLFDEADSLFAKRTEVKSSVDRYANLEVNYLLQRIERFEGISILTTNLESSIDAAFKRRLTFRLDFPFPEYAERLKLWAAMIPAEAKVEEALDFEELARSYEMSGGNIRNAVLRAAFLAAGEGSILTMRHMLRAADLEYSSMGRVFSSSSAAEPR